MRNKKPVEKKKRLMAWVILVLILLVLFLFRSISGVGSGDMPWQSVEETTEELK